MASRLSWMLVPARPALACRVSTQDLISVPSETVPRTVQPAGVVRVADLAVDTKRSSRSPVCTDDGTVTAGLAVLESEEDVARHCGPAGSSAAATWCVT